VNADMQDLLIILDAMLAKKADVADGRELLFDMGERIVKAVAGAFGVKVDEVAILLATSDERHLRFVAPRRFTDLGTIPVTKRDSIAVGVFNRKVGEAMNNVPLVRHVAFFETVKIKDRAAPIQKMITVPILAAGRPIGVAQISRKGESPSAAGPDFTPADVRKAQEIFEGLATRLADARPDAF
jgi:hypothetical protein